MSLLRAGGSALLGLLAAALVVVLLPAAAQADSPFCAQRTLAIVAHQDDDLLFQSPDLLETIAAGGCVQTVFVTAGDAGLGTAYWQEREEGSRAAYATMAGVPNTWNRSEETFSGHRLHVATLVGNPALSEVYMRLPNGGRSGGGYQATGFVSLPKLWRSHNPQPANLTPINELSALDGSAAYTYEGLLATLKALILDFEPDVILTQDFTEEFNAGDHGDHIVVARLAKLADGSYSAEHVFRGYMDYRSMEQPVNVVEPQLGGKTQAFNAYRAHDKQICLAESECQFPDPDYGEWLKRQYVVSQSAVPGADAGPDQSVASKATVTLDGSGSSDPLGNALSYEWKQTAGPAVSLNNSKSAKPGFTAPTGPATLTFSLVVKSSEASSLADAVTVTVAAPKFALQVSTSGNGSGVVTSSPAGINCGSDCEEAYEQGTKVTLTPTPGTGSEFKGWSGACSGAGPCEVTMSSAKSVGAEFDLEQHDLVVTKGGSGSGTVTSAPAGIDCDAGCSSDSSSFDHGALVKLTGTAGNDSKAVVWSGCDEVTGSNKCEVMMAASRQVTATFSQIGHSPLTVNKIGSGTGTVTSAPAGIDCGSQCTAEYAEDTKVVLTGVPGPNSQPVAWEDCPGTVDESKCEVTMDQALSATARFDLEQHALVVTTGGPGSGTVTSSPARIHCGPKCVATFNHGAVVSLIATAPADETVSWAGCDEVLNGHECRVAMDADREVAATFAPIPVPPALPAPPSTPSPPATPEPAPTPQAPPNTKLLKAKIGGGTARFAFEGRGAATRFRCAIARLHRKLTYEDCSSPVTYQLAPGRYVFKVKAAGPGGADPKPITRRFRVPGLFAF